MASGPSSGLKDGVPRRQEPQLDEETEIKPEPKVDVKIDNHSLQKREEEPIDLETIQTAPAAHRRYLSSPTAATLHGKTRGFVLRLPPQNKAHATCMQPSQCILQHDVSSPHVSTHMATHMTTIMQPCQCDLQPQIQETHRTTHFAA